MNWKSENNGTIIVTERVNKQKLLHILKNWEKAEIQKAILTGDKTTEDVRKMKTLYTKYYKGLSKEGTFEVQYNQVGRGSNRMGRYFCKGSLGLQSMSKIVRNTISAEFYDDIDMVNAHPNILLQYCRQNNIDIDKSGAFVNYVEHREKIFRENPDISSDKIKVSFLKVMNGGSREIFRKEPLDNLLKEFQREVMLIHAEVKRLNPKIKPSSDFNELGSICNKVICNIENKILFFATNFLIEQKYDPEVLCFDGLMVRKRDPEQSDLDRVLEELTEHIENETGYSIHFKVKKPSNFINLDFDKTSDLDISDVSLSNIVFSELKGKNMVKWDRKNERLYIFNENTRLWELRRFESLILDINSILSRFLQNNDYSEESKNALQKIISSVKSLTAINKFLKEQISNLDDSLEVENLFDKNTELFPIADNMVIDLKTKQVRERKKTDYFTKTTNRKYLDSPDTKFVYDYLGEVLSTSDNVYKNYMLSTIGYILSGRNDKKRFFILLGEKDTGKSLFINLLLQILGDFSCSPNKRVFKKTKGEAVHDTALFSLMNTRLCSVSELSEDDKFNEDLLKSITGNDFCEIRKAGSSCNVKVKFNCVPFLATNFVPKFKCEAFASRMRVIPFENKFERNLERGKQILDMTDHFFTLAIQNYCEENLKDVPVVLQKTEEVTLEVRVDSFHDWLNDQNDFLFDGDENHKVKKTDLYDSYINHCIKYNLESAGKISFYKKLQSEKNLGIYRMREFIGVCKIGSLY